MSQSKEPKPLTKEAREAYGSVVRKELLSAEAFWREAVKGALMGTIYDGHMICNWCSAQAPQYEEVNHEDDCEWKLAQEPE